MAYYRKLVGEKIYLSPSDIANEVPILTSWLNEDRSIAFNNNFYASVINEAKMQEKLEQWNDGPYCLSIIKKADDTFMGQISLFHVADDESHATLGIFIGEAYRGQGYGKEAVELCLKYAFEEHRFQAIHLEVNAENKAAIRFYQGCGFKICGTWHHIHYAHGAFNDIVLMEYIKG